MNIGLTLSLSRGGFLTLESSSMVCVDRAVCLCCNSKTGISAALAVVQIVYAEITVQYLYVHRKQDSNKYERHVQPMAMSVTSDIFSAPKLCPIFGRIEKMTSLITWEIRPCCASTAIFVLEFICLTMMSNPEFLRYNNAPVFYTFRKLIIILSLFLLLLLL